MEVERNVCISLRGALCCRPLPSLPPHPHLHQVLLTDGCSFSCRQSHLCWKTTTHHQISVNSSARYGIAAVGYQRPPPFAPVCKLRVRVNALAGHQSSQGPRCRQEGGLQVPVLGAAVLFDRQAKEEPGVWLFCGLFLAVLGGSLQPVFWIPDVRAGLFLAEAPLSTGWPRVGARLQGFPWTRETGSMCQVSLEEPQSRAACPGT